jgi:hypothetical protein
MGHREDLVARVDTISKRTWKESDGPGDVPAPRYISTVTCR